MAGNSVADKSVAQADVDGNEGSGQQPAWLIPVGLSVVAFVFRLIVGNANAQFGGDAPQYTGLAKNLAAGHGYSYAHTAPFLASDIRLPGYPALLAVAFRFSESRWSIFILNALLGAVATFLVWLIADGLHLSRAERSGALPSPPSGSPPRPWRARPSRRTCPFPPSWRSSTSS